MAARFRLSLALALLAVVSLRVRTTDGCSPIIPEPPQTLEYKMMKSEVVVQGYTRHRHRDPSFPNDDVYIVDFEIRCIFKGDPMPELIRIYRVGTIGGHCLSTEMPKNRSLLLYLTRGVDGNLEPVYHEDPGDPQYLEEIVGLCETKIAYPEGYSETRNKETCPEPYQYDDCVPIPTMPTYMTSEPKGPTVAAKMDETGTGKSNDNAGGSTGTGNGNDMNKEGDKDKNNMNKEGDQGKNSMNQEGDQGKNNMNQEGGKDENKNNMNKEGDGGMNKGGDHGMKNGDKGKEGNGNEGDEPSYKSVKTAGGSDSDGGAVDTGDSSGNTGNEEEEGFDPDGSVSTFTFNLLVPLAMLAAWLVLV